MIVCSESVTSSAACVYIVSWLEDHQVPPVVSHLLAMQLLIFAGEWDTNLLPPLHYLSTNNQMLGFLWILKQQGQLFGWEKQGHTGHIYLTNAKLYNYFNKLWIMDSTCNISWFCDLRHNIKQTPQYSMDLAIFQNYCRYSADLGQDASCDNTTCIQSNCSSIHLHQSWLQLKCLIY